MNDSSSFWQLVFVSFALVLIVFEVVRGWRVGLVRQLVRLLALVSAYAAGLFGGRMLLPVVRLFFRAPDFVLSLVTGAALALVIYAAINSVGALLFKRTREQPVRFVRFLYGFSGAALGIFFGLFGVWLVVVTVRSLGALAGAENKAAGNAERARPTAVAPLGELKRSLERGSLGEAVRAVDPVPNQTYDTLGKLSTVLSDPRHAERFLSFPGVRELLANPRIITLRDDQEIMELVEQHRYLELLQSPKVIAALNDPALAGQLRSFDFQRALDYALKK